MNDGQRHGQAGQCSQEDDHHLGDVGGEQEEHELTDVGVDDAALLDRSHDTDVVVVGEHHIGRAFGHVGAGDAHRDADIGPLDGRRVIDAIASHGDHLVVAAQGVNDAHLVLRRHTGKDGGMFYFLRQGAIVHAIQIGAGVHLVAFAQQPDALGYRPAGVGIVAGDHDRAQPSRARLEQRRFDFGARRVNHAHQPSEDQPLLGIFAGQFIRYVLVDAVGKAHHPQRIIGHAVIGRADAPTRLIVQRAHLVIQRLVVGAQFQHQVGRALDGDGVVPQFGLILERRRAFLFYPGDLVNRGHAFEG